MPINTNTFSGHFQYHAFFTFVYVHVIIAINNVALSDVITPTQVDRASSPPPSLMHWY